MPPGNQHLISKGAVPYGDGVHGEPVERVGAERVAFGVLGPVTAGSGEGPLALKGPRHRAVLARLIVARRRVVPVSRLVDDLWTDPPSGAVGALQTFVAALRRVLEPDRPPRTPARLLVTEGPGYALRAEPDAVDAWRFEAAVATTATLPAPDALPRLDEALDLWRGPAYAEFAQEDWSRGERSRLTELRLQAVERRAETRLALGRPADAVPDLDAHVSDHPWRRTPGGCWRSPCTGRADRATHSACCAGPVRCWPNSWAPTPGRGCGAWRATSSPRTRARSPGRTGDGRRPAVDHRDRGVRPHGRRRSPRPPGVDGRPHPRPRGDRGGGLRAARDHRLGAISAAEEFGDPELTARVIGAYDVPAIWTRSDDPDLARQVVDAAERTLAALPGGGAQDAARCRLLATIALEMRGTRSRRGPQAAREAVGTARDLDDPALLAFALNGQFMQSFTRAGLAGRRDGIGAELIALSARHGLVTYEVLGRLIRLQARSALGDFAAADAHAAAADRLAERHELPLVAVFTEWYGALRSAASGDRRRAEDAYRAAAVRLDGSGMPGLERGLLPLALLCLRLARHAPSASASASAGVDAAEPGADLTEDWVPTAPGWSRWPCWRQAGGPRHARPCARCPSLPGTCCTRRSAAWRPGLPRHWATAPPCAGPTPGWRPPPANWRARQRLAHPRPGRCLARSSAGRPPLTRL